MSPLIRKFTRPAADPSFKDRNRDRNSESLELKAAALSRALSFVASRLFSRLSFSHHALVVLPPASALTFSCASALQSTAVSLVE